MVAKAKTLIPGDPDDLICDTCPARYTSRGDLTRTMESARVAGWHIYLGPSAPYMSDVIIKKLCPDCVGTPRTRAPRVEVMEGQTDALTELSVTWTPVVKPKPKRGTGGREMS